MIFRAGNRFDEENYFLTEIDTSGPTCEVTGELDGVPVSFFGNSEEGLIIGGNLEWNQLVPDSLISAFGNKIFSEGTEIVEGHKYAVLFDAVPIESAISNTFLYLRQNGQTLINGKALGNNTTKKAIIYEATASGIADGQSNSNNGIWIYCSNLTYANFSSNYLNFIDLTQMFGSEMANALYAMETAEAGSGIAVFKTLFPADYYGYNAGEEKTITLR